MTRRILNCLGIPATRSGQQYIEYAVILSKKDRTLLLSITKRLHPLVAEHFGVSIRSVERNIRYCVKCCWETGNRELLNEIAGYRLHCCPYAGEFIAMLVDYETGRDFQRSVNA